MKIINCILELTALNPYQISCSVLGSCSAQAVTQSSSKALLNADIGNFLSQQKSWQQLRREGYNWVILFGTACSQYLWHRVV